MPLYNTVNQTFGYANDNKEITIVPAAARTADLTTADFVNYGFVGAMLTIDLTAIAAGTIQFTLQGKDSLSGKYYTVYQSAGLAAPFTGSIRIYPGSVTSSTGVNRPMPKFFRMFVDHSAADSCTYSIGMAPILAQGF